MSGEVRIMTPAEFPADFEKSCCGCMTLLPVADGMARGFCEADGYTWCGGCVARMVPRAVIRVPGSEGRDDDSPSGHEAAWQAVRDSRVSLRMTAVWPAADARCNGCHVPAASGVAPAGYARFYADQSGAWWCGTCVAHMLTCGDADCDHPCAVLAGSDGLTDGQRAHLRGCAVFPCPSCLEYTRIVDEHTRPEASRCPCCQRETGPGLCAECAAECAGSPFATPELPYPYCAVTDSSPLACVDAAAGHDERWRYAVDTFRGETEHSVIPDSDFE